jgi:cAMP-dependent protein kinase regulator
MDSPCAALYHRRPPVGSREEGVMTDERQRGLSSLDQAHGLRLQGQREEALRLAASILTAAPDHLGAAALVARLLLEADRATAAGNVAARLVDANLRRGELAGALVAAQLALEAGGFADGALRRIADAFGKGSPRVSQAAQKPPAMPADVEVAPHFAKLAGVALLDAAEKAASRFLKSKDSVAVDAALPELPLFGALEPPRLLKLLGRLELQELDAGQYALREGEEGREAFVLARGVVNVVREETGGSSLLASLGPGAIFGEMALVSNAPRAASAVAVEPVQLLCVSRAALEALAREDPAIGRELGKFCYDRMISNLVRHSRILGSVEPGKRAELIGRFSIERFEPGEALVHQGEEPSCLFLLASGGVQVRSTDVDGDRVVLAELGPGDVVGEISLVLRRPANADVVAFHSTVALALSRDQFQEAIKEHPNLLRELYDTAIQREEETRSVVGQKAVDVSDVVLL